MKKEQIHRLGEFLYTTGGNWRNAICIDCGGCPHGHCAPGTLLTTDYNGRPLLMPITAFQELTGMTVDKAECISVIEHRTFEAFYSLWLKWTADSAADCPLRQAVCKAGWDMPCNT